MHEPVAERRRLDRTGQHRKPEAIGCRLAEVQGPAAHGIRLATTTGNVAHTKTGELPASVPDRCSA